MEGKPVLSPRFPRFAPPRPGLCRSNSRSPTRPSKLADDILSDLSPATTLEAFTNPSGKLKASIEAATPSERAFGLRATLASNKIQEWVEELSGWPWPAEGGSAGFEMPVTERRRPSTPDGDQEARRNSNHGSEHNQEPKYIGSLLSTEVERYENRIDDIAMDMEDLDVEAIKRRVLDTHFSPRSRPSSSGSNASPMSSLFASYIRMDDFTAVITATVLQSLPILSKLTRLMENWNVRLTVLRHIPPLVWALDDAEVALKSGWATIGTPEQSPAGKEQQPHLSYLTRETFEIMRGVLQEKVTRLGQDLDFLLDTLEGRQDTLPEAWLDRMETLENDYGLWVVSGDRKVREGEWARMAKARQEEEDARKLREAEAAETARRNAEEEAEEAARKRAEKGAEEAEIARLKAECEAEEAARLQASKLAQEAEAARHEAEQEVREAAQQRALRGAEAAKIIAEDEARESARIQALKSRDEAAQSRADEETLEAAKQKAVPVAQGAERAQLLGERESDEAAERKAHAMEQSKIQAQQDFADAVSHKLKNDAESAEAQRKELSEATRQRGLLLAEALLVSKRKADQERTAQKMAQLRTDMLTVDTTGAEDTDQRQAAAQKTRDERSSEFIPTTISSAGAGSPQHPDIDCDICVELQQGETPSPLQAPASVTGSAVSSPSIQTQDSVCSLAACDMDGAAKPRISQYAPFDGGYEESDPAIHETQVEIFSNDMITSPGLASPVNLDDSFPQTPTSMLSTSAEVFTSPTSESSIPSPNAKVSRFENAFPSYTRGTSHEKKISDANSTTSIGASGTPVRSPVFTDGANDQSDSGESAIQTATNHGDIAVESPTYEILHSADAQGPQSDRARSSSSTSADIISSSPELTTELRGAQYPEDFPSPASFAGSPDASAHDSAPTTASMFLPSIPTTSNPPGTDIRTPPKSRASFEQSLSWDDSCISVLSPVAEEKMPACTELQNVDGPCEPCELAIRELTPNEDNHLNDIPILGRMIPTPRTDSSAEDGSVSSPKGVAKVTFYGTAGPGYSISVPLDGTSTQTNDALPITYVSCETVNLKEECILDTVENPPALVALSPGMWMVVPPQTVTSISLTGGSPVKPASNGSPGTGLSRRESLSSDASTVINGRVSESPCSPIISPISEDVSELFEDNEPSPSAGRKGQRAGNFYDMSPSGSPPGKLQRPPLNFPKRAPATPSSSTAPATPLATFATPLEAPFFDNIDLSTTPMMNSPKKANSDEQMQQQISSLLESIPARIRLSTEVESTPVVPQTVRTKRSQRSLTPSFRPSSSMSNCSTSRAPTPSFTLAPAYGKPGSRHRPQSNNPEIKLYHLSRSTSEAPIKLFVRLVGEHGERVMVRVGGGWADLGEYLKEYASHHGRRSTVEVSDKVEIQDLPARNVSSSSIATIRNGRASPVPSRPQSVLERERSASASGLRVRKTRRSVGEFSSSSDSVGPARISGARCPSTPIPSTSRAQSQHHDSPPSAASSVDTGRSSRLSWTDEDFSLGLAGPKSKRVVISERDQEWVDSMKEKVKMASAEKEKRERGSTTKAGNAKVEGKESFGEMEKIRGTKRLFMKSGN
ncbi:uncharacterized protein L3040_008444 [Drepanopeziza brunnea f. sp. 'multigermtubi']|uniref:GAS2 domain-containing protein n=1 Tax=Marssonina brunnea f. sp. multigermtubi (strain MB_m1) TaxID=1072389 RepID=K1WFS8_MARBU|nr:GAS2 domain-containing protein [Drepanopeziza brunnea f. sp. 'multigermtubi' MB_m1]EKD16345.1 GAS2 domain-containing protein [Drepanopeziza brunnea f. sp. 'multigermtubi' MB_m1]KAJ5033326.1 hypothetical protein L3040_008444 [Drepanopeziza brunnea f. sp. 'multigermtubi']